MLKKRIHDLIFFYDPTGQYLVMSLAMTFAPALGTLFWLFFRKPCAGMIVICPMFFIINLYSCERTVKHKILIIIISFLSYSGCFIIASMFVSRIYIFLFVVFVLIYLLFLKQKFLYLTANLSTMIAVSIQLPPGYDQAFNRVFEVFISSVIALAVYILFEYLFGRFLIKKSIVHTSEIIYNLFNVFTDSDHGRISKDDIENKYIQRQGFLNRTDIIIEDVYPDTNSKLYHRITLGLSKIDLLVNKEEYFFTGNNEYSRSVNHIYELFRKLSGHIVFFNEYEKYADNIRTNFPQTIRLIDYISAKLKNYILLLKIQKITECDYEDNDIVSEWQSRYREIHLNSKSNISKEELKIYFALNTILTIINEIKKDLNSEKVVEFLKN